MAERVRTAAAQVGDVLTLRVEKPAAGGEMIARADGQVVFVAGAIPGERVTARVERIGKHTAHARVTAIEEPSPDRRESSADPLCGGAVYSHITYPRQLAIKAEVIADAFARIGKLPLPAPVPVEGSPEEGYRMRARLHVRGQRLGFFREGTHDVCDARQSRQLLPATCDALDRLMAAARSLGIDSIREIELSENVAASERVVYLDTTGMLDVRSSEALAATDGFTDGPYVTDTIAAAGQTLTLRRHVLAFFQGNRYLLGPLVEHVVAQLPRRAAVADLYAGAGLFAVAASVVREAAVTAVESDRYAAEDLHANAAAAGGAIATIRGDVESFQRPSGALDAVIVDPPRTGMSKAALDRVLSQAPPRLIYVSCDVATLARDARRIVDHGYRLTAARAFDLFPNTPHVETVIVFDRG
jgi:23S rRNA (uracil1939-C5)-methyltransferase